jgi:DTW domain-containing protein YfiP
MRKTCKRCLKPLLTCFCQALTPIENRVKLIILVHPDEEKHPYNTALMTKLNFKNSKLIIGENLSYDSQLRSEVSRPGSYILYPHETAKKINTLSSAQKKEIKTLILLDGTWRKAKRILYQTQFLQDIPLLQLPENLNSIYHIRKAPQKNFLSTLEAATHSLNLIEKQNYSCALNVLQFFVDKHKEYMTKKS